MSKKEQEDLKIGIMNGEVAADFYQKNPCTVGYSYMRLEVSGAIKGCCVAKYALGDATKQNWQNIWNSREFESFREKMKTINQTHFHLKDPEWGFCQQCSHRFINTDNARLLQIPFDEEEEK